MSTSQPPSTPDWRSRLDALTSATRSVARDTAQNAGEAVRNRKQDQPARQERFDPTGWYGALLVMVVAAFLLWVLQVINSATGYRINAHAALVPRTGRGLVGVLVAPFLHTGYFHLLSNTAPFVLIGWVVLLAGVRTMAISTAIVTVVGGLLAWAIAPSGAVLGAGLLIIGWMGFLIARAYFSRSFKWILVAVLVLFFFGTLLGALVPHFDRGTSWEAYAAYFVAGAAAGALLHRRRGPRQRRSRPRRQGIRDAFADGVADG